MEAEAVEAHHNSKKASPSRRLVEGHYPPRSILMREASHHPDDHAHRAVSPVTEATNDNHHSGTPTKPAQQLPLGDPATKTSSPGESQPIQSKQEQSPTTTSVVPTKAHLDNLMHRWNSESNAFAPQASKLYTLRAKARSTSAAGGPNPDPEDDPTSVLRPFEALKYEVFKYCLAHLPGYAFPRAREDSEDVRAHDGNDGRPQPAAEETPTQSQILALTTSMENCLSALGSISDNTSHALQRGPPVRGSFPAAARTFAVEAKRVARVLAGKAVDVDTSGDDGESAEETPHSGGSMPVYEMSGAIVDDGAADQGETIGLGTGDSDEAQGRLRRKWIRARFNAVMPLCGVSWLRDSNLAELEEILELIEALPGAPTTEMSLLKHRVRGLIMKVSPDSG
ncbi:hypothetical protein QBC33DRAFT_561846 [Phialemonium atrogriseum]|uniref:Uncharacterized protein n=1 Tax=Phialemonium atrogriseum TaxID=1093897 RepID=A0AAJ0BUD0_9PEZI|nr:uncharacterized protein QBC33DRAFT_561846 [Phialemonium atrogriseum]KAK1764455.1 hypothetical protein QBC33DRAFT_561846 [Phialemonium atrogriseum]